MRTLAPLSATIRAASREQHTEAENSSFVVDLMKGRLSLSDYARYLANLAVVYEALEKQTARGTAFAGSDPIWDAKLNRLPKIENDLVQLGHPHWRTELHATDAAQEYARHISSLNGRADIRLLAHHYTRYLGDLSGGQAIAALVARHYGATEDQLSFYRFPDIESIVHYKENYRKQLDALPVTDADQDLLIAEVQRAFRVNQSIFDDLARN